MHLHLERECLAECTKHLSALDLGGVGQQLAEAVARPVTETTKALDCGDLFSDDPTKDCLHECKGLLLIERRAITVDPVNERTRERLDLLIGKGLHGAYLTAAGTCFAVSRSTHAG